MGCREDPKDISPMQNDGICIKSLLYLKVKSIRGCKMLRFCNKRAHSSRPPKGAVELTFIFGIHLFSETPVSHKQSELSEKSEHLSYMSHHNFIIIRA